jgi:hypothetical protein
MDKCDQRLAELRIKYTRQRWATWSSSWRRRSRARCGSLFQKQWPLYWTEDERGEFAASLETDNIKGAALKEIRRALED